MLNKYTYTVFNYATHLYLKSVNEWKFRSIEGCGNNMHMLKKSTV